MSRGKVLYEKANGRLGQEGRCDYRVGRKLARSRPAEHDFVCFCFQQAAEKFLKRSWSNSTCVCHGRTTWKTCWGFCGRTILDYIRCGVAWCSFRGLRLTYGIPDSRCADVKQRPRDVGRLECEPKSIKSWEYAGDCTRHKWRAI